MPDPTTDAKYYNPDRIAAGGDTKLIEVAPTVQASPNYLIDCVMGGKQTIPDAARIAGGSGVISFISISAKFTVGAVRIFFFKSDPSSTTFTENAPLNVAAADRHKMLGHIDLGALELAELVEGSILTKTNVNIPFKLASGTSLFAVCVARAEIIMGGTDDLMFNYGIPRD